MEINQQQLRINLTVEQTNLLLNALGGLPFNTAAPLVALIRPQAQQQVDEILAANEGSAEQAAAVAQS